MWIWFSVLVLFFLTALVIYRGSENPLQDERGFELSDQGTYGTAGFMKEEEQAEILRADKTMDGVNGIIFGRELGTGKVLSLPVDSRLNRNIAVCGSQGSMKSRAFARVMALQCVRRGESMYITDPKSELYEDLCAYLKESGYVVKQLNLIQLTHSDAWNCLAEIDEGELIDVFCDVVIRNTTDKFDHFYDNVEMDLLKRFACMCMRNIHQRGGHLQRPINSCSIKVSICWIPFLKDCQRTIRPKDHTSFLQKRRK